MPIMDIQHVAIKSLDLEASNKFYTEVLGMELAPRPYFTFPGSWLKMGHTMIHIMAGHAAVDAEGKYTPGGAAVDHIALAARNFDEMKKKAIDSGLKWSQFNLPDFKLWQLFIKDPNGVTIELNFSAPEEPKGSVGPTEDNLYDAGKF